MAGMPLGDSVAGMPLGDAVAGMILGDAMAGMILGDAMGGMILGDAVAGMILGDAVAGMILGDAMAGMLVLIVYLSLQPTSTCPVSHQTGKLASVGIFSTIVNSLVNNEVRWYGACLRSTGFGENCPEPSFGIRW